MDAVTKRFFIGLGIFALAAMVFLGAWQQKAEASVSWGQEVTEVAKLYKGVKYKWGGKTPKQGFDASGFTQFIYDDSAAHIKLPRTTKEQYKAGENVAIKDLQEGDLVFFNTNGKGASFVGIYLEKGNFIAVTVSKGVSIQSMDSKYWKTKYVGAKRVLKQY
ncbi:C40 family peptidase [Heyndrickxia sp. MSNUG]|uniref:C40 family peptidase n=1 Tax=Heyndrickxia sp. MSNUG TaxID=3136677 RepID=UPI003C2FD472